MSINIIDIAILAIFIFIIFSYGKYENWKGKEKIKRKLRIIFRILKGEEFVPRAEGSAVNDNTVVIVNFLGNKMTERPIGDFYNPNTGRIEIIYDFEKKEE